MPVLHQWIADSLQINGHTVALKRYSDHETTTPAVLLPGITASVDFWPVLLQVFPVPLRAVSVSLPGHAPSTVPSSFCSHDVNPRLFADIVRQAAELTFPGERVVLVGWSTGGFASLATAILHPSRVKSVVSINGFARGTWGDLLGMMQKLALSHWGHALFHRAFRTMSYRPWLFERVMRRLRGHRDAPNEVATHVLQMMFNDGQKNNIETMQKLFAGLRRVDLTDQLSSIECPVQILSGAQDVVIPPAEGTHLHKRIPNSELIELPEAGHLFFADALPQVIDVVSRALR